jgi:hypothetical protein
MLSGAPINLQYDLTSKNFQLLESRDLTLRGQYSVSLSATITVSDGLVPATIQTYSAAISFTVTINPCPINSFTLSPSTIGPIEYVLGNPGFSFGAYLFTQNRNCNYT